MLSIGVDWVALSFVQTPADIEEIHALIDEKLPKNAFKPAVMAKIEKPSCFSDDNLERIVELCNGIMVARGDVRTVLRELSDNARLMDIDRLRLSFFF